eukprot:TRINITY_DN4_c0_g1_i3.p1 TRINITY_DN4_c0_g1~~TRINITY_DN4_c0_g1_i3.p1  ORF type:complete len:396 (-),score=77.15 TRINITY_DN4_c0_g1_i3:57-1172(-)
MGAHVGLIEAGTDRQQMHFKGTNVVTAEFLGNLAQGGQIIVSNPMATALLELSTLCDVGTLEVMHPAPGSDFSFYQFVPSGLSDRVFITTVASSTETDKLMSPSWMIDFGEISVSYPCVGKGTFGAVYRGEWRSQPVAVKKLFGQMLDAVGVAEFRAQLKEIAELSMLRHPRLVLFVCACTQSPNLCICTEWMHQGSLAGLLRRKGALAWGQAQEVMHSVALGLVFLHASNICHRSLKSANILIAENGEIKLSDYGLPCVKAYNQGSTLMAVHAAWAAPEVLIHSEHTKATDIYSYGVVMWEVVTGDTPFKGVEAAHLLDMILEGQRPEIPHPLPIWYPPAYIKLMQECWLTEPADRPNSMTVVTHIQAMK